MEREKNLRRLLCIVDTETTGLNEGIHEVIEIGVVLIDRERMEVVGEWEKRIRPVDLPNAEPKALEINGYSEALWVDAVSLSEALVEMISELAGGELAFWNMTFDDRFIRAAFRKEGMEYKGKFDYHQMCIWSAARLALEPYGLHKTSLKAVCEFLGIEPEDEVHRAIGGARAAAKVYLELLRRQKELIG